MTSMHTTGVGVLDKSMAIVDLCERQPASASDIARELDLTVSTAHRLAAALTAHGLLQRDATGLYRLGRRFLTSRVAEIAHPVLERLTHDTGESAQLWVLRGEDRLCLASVITDTELRVVMDVGVRLPLADGGSASLALQGDVGPEGWAETHSTRTPGLGSVSAPVILHGEPVAAVSVIAPLLRMTKSPGETFGKEVLAAAADIVHRLEE
ncbi:MAG TPA: helix-turn-helix domain-containing protein [Nocardioides sp.]|jgi:DNA-binding IclR family transcriptional regulator|nr:helix-turn-helix domain-containing protein [Nocardioides sp.]